MAAKLKKGDRVVVLTGKDKGKTGEITQVLPKDNKAVVDGVNIALRHTRQSQTSQGGRVPKNMPIDLSNLALMDANGKPTRVGFRMEGDKKVRFAKTTGDVICCWINRPTPRGSRRNTPAASATLRAGCPPSPGAGSSRPSPPRSPR